MAKYTSDANLIKGAAVAHKDWSNVSGMYAGIDAITDKALAAGEKALQDRKDLEIKLDKSVEDVLAKASSLGKNYHDYIYEQTKSTKKDILKAMHGKDQKGIANANFLIQDLALEVKDMNQIGLDHAEAQSKGKLSSAMFKPGAIEGKQLEKMLSHDYTVDVNADNERVFKMVIDDKPYELTKAQYAKIAIPKHFETGAAFGKSFVNSVKSPAFDGISFKSSIHGSLPENETELRAAMSDEIFSGKSFEDILTTGLVEQELVHLGYADGDGTIQQEELDNFMDAITNPENINFDMGNTRDIMATKITKYGEDLHTEHWAEKQRQQQRQQRLSNSRITTPETKFTINRNVINPAFDDGKSRDKYVQQVDISAAKSKLDKLYSKQPFTDWAGNSYEPVLVRGKFQGWKIYSQDPTQNTKKVTNQKPYLKYIPGNNNKQSEFIRTTYLGLENFDYTGAGGTGGNAR